MAGNRFELKFESCAFLFQLWHEFPRWPKAGTFISAWLFAICKTGLASPPPSYNPFYPFLY